MIRVIVLDSGPLSMATNPRRSAKNLACAHWVQDLLNAGHRVILPEVADYEVRRELLRASKTAGIARLDAFAVLLEYLPINSIAMRQAAELWAQVRRLGRPTSGAEALDADAILAAQAVTLGVSNTTIATTNLSHLSRFATAELWENIPA